MTKYKCGCETDGVIILDDNELSILAWLDWSETVGVSGNRDKCFDCYIKKELK